VLKEMRLAIMECGRRLQRFLRRRRREVDEQKKRDYITKYLDTIGEALQEILAFSDAERARTTDSLKVVLEQSRTMAVSAEERARKRKVGDDDAGDTSASSLLPQQAPTTKKGAKTAKADVDDAAPMAPAKTKAAKAPTTTTTTTAMARTTAAKTPAAKTKAAKTKAAKTPAAKTPTATAPAPKKGAVPTKPAKKTTTKKARA
jgi:hypothetical protein